MAGQDIWWSYWYFHLPNYALSVLFYTMFGRFALGLLLPPDSPNYIYRWFRRLTDWVVAPVAFVTPRALHGPLLAPVAAFWIMGARVTLFAVLYAAELLPRAVPAVP
ncbi:MAG: YggT family protein [Rhodospirillaceae bacterium]|nr:YggT family protein [Rhodospirillaceae bacterium]